MIFVDIRRKVVRELVGTDKCEDLEPETVLEAAPHLCLVPSVETFLIVVILDVLFLSVFLLSKILVSQ